MAMKSLGKKEDVAASKKAVAREERHFLKIPDSKTPWHLFGIDYTEGYVHWVPVAGNNRRFVCAGGMKGHGFDPDNCAICAYVADLYADAKELENDDDSRAPKVKKLANDQRGKAEFQMKALRGNRLLMKTKTGKKFIADWDSEDDDSNAEAGVLSLSESQFLGLTDMVDNDDTFPFITDGPDLAKRVLWTFKEQKKGKKSNYSQVGWTADKEESDFPDFDIPEAVAEMNLEDSFVIDVEALDKIADVLRGETSEEVDTDEAVDYETESDVDAEPDDEYLNDVEEDDDQEAEDKATEEDLEEGAEEFIDDIPDDPTPKPRGSSKGRGTKERTSGGRSGKGVQPSRGRSTTGSSTSGRRKM